MKFFEDTKYGYKYEIVSQIPRGMKYKVWNVGRAGFPHPGYIPLCQTGGYDGCQVNKCTLIAYDVGSEVLALEILKAAAKNNVKDWQVAKMINEFYED